MDKTGTVYDALYKNQNNYLTKALYDTSPLYSQELADLAEVRFKGKKPTDNQKNILADYVGALFGADSANRFYSYNTPFEDTANLFTEAMMRYNFGLLHDTAFINKPTITDPSYTDYIVSWGARNRTADPSIKPRAEFLVKQILPDFNDWDAIFAQGTGSVALLPTGQNWGESIVPSNRQSRSAYIEELNQKKVPESDFNMHR